MAGIATDGCVMATFADSRMHGYYPVVVSDTVARYNSGVDGKQRSGFWH